MRRSLILVFVTAWLMVPSLASADHGIESVHGGGKLVVNPLFEPEISGSFGISAQDGPGGTRGHVHFRQVNETANNFVVHFEGDVDCLEVIGNTAVLSGDVSRFSVSAGGFGPPAERFMVAVVDGGNPEDGDTVDTAFFHWFWTVDATDPATCITTGGGGQFFGVPEKGNIRVHDDI
jgi:hypothetical protein